jgi:hypothetical protein
MATFLRIFSHDGIFGPARPPLSTLSRLELRRPLHPFPSKTNESKLPVLSHDAYLPILSGYITPVEGTCRCCLLPRRD